jgi:spore maturation protein CgeB
MGTDVNERVFKVLGSGGLAVTDVGPYHEWFGPDELLVPQSLAEYHDMIRRALDDRDFNQRYREAGYEAVCARHTYAHRARLILHVLGFADNGEAGVSQAQQGFPPSPD